LTLYSNQCIDVGDISLRAMQWLQGYYDNSNHHYKDSTTTYVITLVIGINNNTTQDSTNLTNNAKNLYNKIVDTLYEYAAVLNSFASTNHYHFEFQIAGGDDIEQAFGPPSSAKPWVNGWGVAYTASNVKMALINFGGWLATCHDKVCFPKPIATANGWAPSDAYDVSFASGVRFPFPQVPNANRGTFWHDLDLAAQDAGKTKMLFWGVWWGCTESTVKAEPSPSQAYRDFAGRVKQKPLYLTRGHALNRQAEVCES